MNNLAGSNYVLWAGIVFSVDLSVLGFTPSDSLKAQTNFVELFS
jgi:hypothetical protein